MSDAESRSDTSLRTSPPADPGLQAAVKLRFPLLDVVRVAAMLDVVSIHVVDRPLFWAAGVPAFIVMSVALAVRRPDPLPLKTLVPRRADRVLVPWLWWSAVFGLSSLASTLTNPAVALSDTFYPWMGLAGTRIHLWFLPFIFVAEVAAALAVRRLRWVPTSWLVGGAVAAAVVLLSATGWLYDQVAPAYEGMTLGSPDAQERARFYGFMTHRCWLYGTVSVCLGVALGRVLSLSRRRGLRVLWAGSVAMLALAVVMQAAGPQRLQNWGVSPSVAAQWLAQAVAFAVVTTGFQVTGRGFDRLEKVAALTMGVYLLHKWVDLRLADAELIFGAGQWTASIPWLTDGIGRTLLVWAATTVLVAALRRWRAMRRVL